jgi:phage gp29-like protein
MARMPLIQQPITSIGTWDNVRTIDAIVDEAENGQFANSARLVDQVLRDDRAFSSAMTRILGLLGKPQEFKPWKDTAQGRNQAEELKTMWPDMCEHSSLVELLIWGLMLGVGVAQIIQTHDPWKIEVWHPCALQWDAYEGCYYVQGRDSAQLRISPDGKGGFVDDKGHRWVLFTPYGYANAGRRGLLRNLAHLYLERQWAHRDRARYSEIHGQPMRVGIAPTNSTKEERDLYKKKISPLGAESTVVVQQGKKDEGDLWDLKLVEANGKSQELFECEIAELDRAISTLFLGQSQTTDGQAGLGSNDQAGEPTFLKLLQADAVSLTSTLRAQFLVPYYQFAYGNGDMAPWWCIKVDPPEDTQKKAAELQALVDALVAAQTAALPVDVRATLERFGVDMLTEEEQARMEAEKQAKDAEAMQKAQLPAKNGINAPPPAA